ncbi:MAG: hypothetical protein NXI30_09555 [bacterium]|nr:hypothetical protein [bacterium]
MKTFARSLFIACLLSPAVVGSSQAEPRSAGQLAQEIGLSTAAIERVIAGEIVAEELAASSEKDLALALVARLDAPVGAVTEFLDAKRMAEVQTFTLSSGTIDPARPSLANLELPDESLAKLVRRPADTFHLSEAEARRIEAAAERGAEAALDAYRSALAERAAAYWKRGLSGIESYAGSDRSPKLDLAHANAAIRELTRDPVFDAELETIPSKSPGKARHVLSWAVSKGRDFAAPVLIHRIFYLEAGAGEIVVERRFYSGHDYDALQIVVGVLPTPETWSAIFYTNHTYTAQVTGIGGGAKRSIGRKLLRQELVAELERAREAIAGR